MMDCKNVKPARGKAKGSTPGPGRVRALDLVVTMLILLVLLKYFLLLNQILIKFKVIGWLSSKRSK